MTRNCDIYKKEPEAREAFLKYWRWVSEDEDWWESDIEANVNDIALAYIDWLFNEYNPKMLEWMEHEAIHRGKNQDGQ